jgi:DNA-binding NarL/FixJ family response regulator
MRDGTRVLLADDHLLVRAGIRKVLEEMPGIQVIGEAGDGPEVLSLAARHAPDIVLLDVALPLLNGLEVAARLVREQPHVRIVMLSMHADQEYVSQALRAGAKAYLLKDATVPELEIAMKAVMRGETYLSPGVSRHVVEAYVRRADSDERPEALTPRQREVLVLIVLGHKAKDIASRLGLSVKTIETHRAQIMERLDIRDVPGLVRYAIRTGLVKADR